MGRSQEFDTVTVIAAALDVFWDRGYEGASLAELEATTGLNRSSLYNTFTNKRGLFDSAVQMYLNRVIRPRLQGLATNPTHDAVDEYFAALARAVATMTPDTRRRGCLLLNTATTPAANDESIADVIRGYRQELLASIENGVRAASTTASADVVRERASILLSCNVSALILARVDPRAAVAELESARRLNRQWSN
ncbi:TetR/AcrR family transcriptional repressor of nem operon [Rhodococcus sp. 27YEA15]|uniref:TetR/AcrR family transcriptional regulator n=1 Tax=Rhodococcus sp. 27YEA15 TaxID=3156259 RepID=UPI003C7B4049